MPSTQASVLIGALFLLLGTVVKKRATKMKLKNQVPFVHVVSQSLSHNVIKIGSRTLKFDLTLPADTIEPLFSGAAWAGTVVWPASVYLANYIARKGICDGACVIELGAGVGLPGITAGVLGAKRVIVTEQPPLSDLLERNIQNLFADELAQRKYRIETLDWTKPIPEHIGEIDLVLISDCIYEGLYGESWRALAQVLNLLLTRENRALNCVERRKEDGIDRFIELCEKQYSIKSTIVSRLTTNEKRITELYEMQRI